MRPLVLQDGRRLVESEIVVKIKTTIYIHYLKYKWEDKGCFRALFYKVIDDSEQIYVCSQEIEMEVPDDFDPTGGMIAALEKQKAVATAAFQKSVATINEEISKLQALEFTK